MAQTQLSKKLGNDNSIFDVDERASFKSSKFNLSRKTLTTIDIGNFVPVDWFETYPGDYFRCSARYLLESFPLSAPPMCSYRLHLQAYYIDRSSLWYGHQSFSSKGRSGNIDLIVPFCTRDKFHEPHKVSRSLDLFSGEYSDETAYFDTVSSLASYLGLPSSGYEVNSSTGSTPRNLYLPYCPVGAGVSHVYDGYIECPSAFNALPFLFYQKIWRHAIAPSNLMQDSKVWFPDSLANPWWINYDKTNFDGVFFHPDKLPDSEKRFGSIVPCCSDYEDSYNKHLADTCVNVLQLRYAMFDDDYFVTAKPWLVRGSEIAKLSTGSIDWSSVFAPNSILNQEPINVSTTYPNTFLNDSSGATYYEFGLGVIKNVDPMAGSDYYLAGAQKIGDNKREYNYGATSHLRDAFSRARTSFDITANNLRQLIALSVWEERNVLTNGNYNEFVKAHWGVNPHTAEHEPIYLGGFSADIRFGEIIQTSASTPGGNPLGSPAGLGNSNGSGDLFEFKCKDYGYIMLCMYISPEVFYTQGAGHEWTNLRQSELFFPEFAQLGYEPILNKEIFISSADSSDNEDEGLFGYQTRFSYLKMRRNRITGPLIIRYSTDRLLSVYSQARYFSSVPRLSLQFACMFNNIRRDFLCYYDYPAFRLQFATDLTCIRRLPYVSEPNTFGF
ncbi:major capsid protein [Capybara microvirus Cap3_SP_320]|nr:major capsid protein [Capybara microvirus Cap3_SP_320]